MFTIVQHFEFCLGELYFSHERQICKIK